MQNLYLSYTNEVSFEILMSYLEQDEAMPAFIRDLKAYSEIQFQYHSQHSSAIRELESQNQKLTKRIEKLEGIVYSITGENKY
tara:strand:+ start:138 stop:386 length:249 start_codon:yes stop_codon:yes gene_type:complete